MSEYDKNNELGLKKSVNNVDCKDIKEKMNYVSNHTPVFTKCLKFIMCLKHLSNLSYSASAF